MILPAPTHPFDGVRCVLAPNPSPMTAQGTNTFILGSGAVAVIDPGPAIASHQEAIQAALKPGETISHIFVTHSHLDHSPLAKPLSEASGAPVYAFGDSLAGRSPLMSRLAQQGVRGGEGVDATFRPDVTLSDGATIEGRDWAIEAIHTPGHFCNHLSFRWGDMIFSGDHIMAWAPSLVSPPDGDMAAYMASLERILSRKPTRLLPAHGPVVADPTARIAELISHRKGREAALLAAIHAAPGTVRDLTRRVYTDVSPTLIPAAERNVFAHLIDLTERNIIVAKDGIAFSTTFSARQAGPPRHQN